jgi:hypothetical protein
MVLAGFLFFVWVWGFIVLHYTVGFGLGFVFGLGFNSVADCVWEEVCSTLLCWIPCIGVWMWVWEHVDKPYLHA